MKKPTLKSVAQKGFSLVELLVVIAVIAVIAAIAIPNIAGITQSANISKAQRNAQNIVSTFSALRAAGYNATHTKDSAITVVSTATPVQGDPATNGMNAQYSIGGLNLSPADRTEAATYIEVSGDGATLQLIYASGGGAGGNGSGGNGSGGNGSGPI